MNKFGKNDFFSLFCCFHTEIRTFSIKLHVNEKKIETHSGKQINYDSNFVK